MAPGWYGSSKALIVDQQILLVGPFRWRTHQLYHSGTCDCTRNRLQEITDNSVCTQPAGWIFQNNAYERFHAMPRVQLNDMKVVSI